MFKKSKMYFHKDKKFYTIHLMNKLTGRKIEQDQNNQ